MHAILALLLAAAIQVTTVVWKDAPPTMPKGTKMAVLEGNPQSPGIFTLRLKVPAGAKLAPHIHPNAERVTVLSGKVVVTINGKSTTFTTGSFYVNPPNEVHSVAFPQESVLQLTCEGPWKLRYVN
ncbi:MAG TPA: cupin domain-containing protein [Thermoanaerobaculia bacterium]|nr:cupin domain-containing protein [Thermoanaerobaculia bacterium]